MTLPTVRVVVVAFNSAASITSCIHAALGADGYGFCLEGIVVVDNASSDGTVEAIPSDPRVKVIRNDDNHGFARACNQGARGAASDLLLFLNPDTCTGRDAIGRAANTLLADSRAAVCGVRLANPDGSAGVCAARRPSVRLYATEMVGLTRIWPRRFPPSLVRLDGRGTVEVDQVSGAFFLLRRSTFEGAGGFDERYFLYYEEADLSARLARAGWRSIVDLDGACVHEGGGSSRSVVGTTLFLNLRSRIVFARTHMGRVRAAVVVLLTLAVEPPMRTIYLALKPGPPGGGRELVRSYARLIRWLAQRDQAWPDGNPT